MAIAQLLRATKPDRMWIEPSGLGHPAALVDVLRGEHLASALDLQPIICLVREHPGRVHPQEVDAKAVAAARPAAC